MIHFPGISDDDLPQVAPPPEAAPYLESVDPEFYEETVELARSLVAS